MSRITSALDKLRKFSEAAPSNHAGHSHLTFESISALADGLLRAKDAHAEFERQYGPDANWPLWYASFLALEQGLGVSESLIPKPKPCKGAACLVPSQVESVSIPITVKDEYWSTHE